MAKAKAKKPPARAATQVVRGTPEEGAKAIADLLASRRLI